MLEDGKVLEQFTSEHRSAAQRIRDALHDLLLKIKRALGDKELRLSENQKAAFRDLQGKTQEMEALFSKALEATQGSKNAANEGGEARYSLKGKTADGIEVYETSEEVRNMPYKQRMEAFLNIMRNEYAGRTAKFTANGNVYYAKFNDTDLKKNLYGDKRSDRSGWNAKVRTGADGNIFELVENAAFKGSDAERGKATASHKGVSGWDYFVKTVQIDGQVYNLLANVRKKPDGEYVYSIQLNKDKNKAPAPPVARAYTDANTTDGYASERVPTNASAGNVSQNGRDVKKRYSLKEYTPEEQKQHVKDAVSHFGKTYRWNETGYLTPNGTKFDFSGRHEGAPGGYRTVDHRDIRDARSRAIASAFIRSRCVLLF